MALDQSCKYRTWYGIDFEVQEIDQFEDLGLVGECNRLEQRITVARRSNLGGYVFTPQERERHLCHEETHANIFPFNLTAAYLAAISLNTFVPNPGPMYQQISSSAVVTTCLAYIIYMLLNKGLEERLVQFAENLRFGKV